MTKKLILVFLTLIPFLAEAQSFYAIRRPRNLTVYGGTGTALYKGELVNPDQLGKVSYNLVIGSEYYFSKRFTVRAEATWFRIAGSDANANDDRVERNLSFHSNNQELAATGTVHLMKQPKEFYKRSAFNVYAFAGVGVVHINPKADMDDKSHALQPLQTEGVEYSQFHLVVPYGIGVKIMINPLYNIIVEGGYRSTFTDYLDDISIKRYPDPTTLKPEAVRFSDRRQERIDKLGLDQTVPPPGKGVRGNPEQNDGYFLMNIKLQYYLPSAIGANAQSQRFYKKKRKSTFNPKRR